jgi:type III restriction enzyme
VKVPRLPVLDDAIQGELPKFRDIYNVIRKDNPRALPAKGRGKQAKSAMDPQNLPHLLGQAIEALYGQYKKVYSLWEGEPALWRAHDDNSSSKCLASFRSSVLKPSVNQA